MISRAEQEVQLVRGCSHLNMAWSKEDGKMFAFLSIFHPEMSLEQRLELAHSMGDQPYVSAKDFRKALRELSKGRKL